MHADSPERSGGGLPSGTPLQGRRTLVERTGCPACGSVAAPARLLQEPFDGKPLGDYLRTHYRGRARAGSVSGLDYRLVRCAECGLAYQLAVPGQALLAEIYDEWIPPAERERLRQEFTLDRARYLAEQVEFLIQYFGRPPAALRVFDFGLGWAEWACMARAYGCQVAGSELSRERQAHARDLGIPVWSLDELPEAQFDFVNTEQVFEHLVEPLDVLQRLVRSLRPGGLLKISVPDARATLVKLASGKRFADLSANEIMPIAPLEHVNCFEAATLVRLGRRAGLRPIRPSIRMLLNSASGWLHLRRALRLTARPIYRHVYPRSTFIYFAKTDP